MHCNSPPVIGCIALGLNLRDTLNKFYASDIGTDNELLTRGNPGNAQWLASIQKTEGRCKGHHTSAMKPAPQPKAKKKGGKKGKVRPADEDDEDEEASDEGMELQPIKAKPKKQAAPAAKAAKPRRKD